MLTDTHAKFEVKSLASFSAIKFQSLVAFSTTNARKTGQSITIGKTAKESVKCLQSRVKTSRCHGFTIDVIVVVVVVSCTSSCKEVGPKWRRVFRLICCVTVDRRCLLGQGPLHNMTWCQV